MTSSEHTRLISCGTLQDHCWHHDRSQAGLPGAGSWPVRPAAGAGPGGATDMAYRTRYRKNPTSVYPGIAPISGTTS
jgi:hypothetical protein